MRTLAFLIGVLAAGAALADDFHQPTASEFLTNGSLAVLFVGLTVRVLRRLLKDVLAPKVPTKTSKNLTLLVALVAGAVWGYFHVGVQVTPGLAGWILGGVRQGAAAFTLAGAVGT